MNELYTMFIDLSIEVCTLSLKDRFKFLMERLNLSIADFSRITGIPYRSIQSYLRGERKEISAENALKIASALKVNINWLVFGTGEPFEHIHMEQFTKIPVYTADKSDIVLETPSEYIYLPTKDITDKPLAIKAKGDSMFPTIRDGDYVLYLPMPVDIFSGDIVIVRNEWGEVMIRRYREKGKQKLLFSDNPDYPPIQPNEYYKIIGKAIMVWRKILLS